MANIEKADERTEDREMSIEEMARDAYISDLIFIETHVITLSLRIKTFHQRQQCVMVLDAITVLKGCIPNRTPTPEDYQQIIAALVSGGVEGVLRTLREHIVKFVVDPIVDSLFRQGKLDDDMQDEVYQKVTAFLGNEIGLSAAYAFVDKMRLYIDESRERYYAGLRSIDAALRRAD